MELVTDVGIPFERIYSKPLNERNDLLVQSVLLVFRGDPGDRPVN